MLERTGRREGSCGGGMSREDGFFVGLYINGNVKGCISD